MVQWSIEKISFFLWEMNFDEISYSSFQLAIPELIITGNSWLLTELIKSSKSRSPEPIFKKSTLFLVAISKASILNTEAPTIIFFDLQWFIILVHCNSVN